MKKIRRAGGGEGDGNEGQGRGGESRMVMYGEGGIGWDSAGVMVWRLKMRIV